MFCSLGLGRAIDLENSCCELKLHAFCIVTNSSRESSRDGLRLLLF